MGTSVEDDDAHPFAEDLAMEILQSRSFIDKHFNYGKNKRPKLLIHDLDAPDYSIPITFISDSDKNEGTPLIEKPDHVPEFGGGLLVVPVDGLFLFQKGNTEYDIRGWCCGLWNPATRVLTTLPAAHFQLQPFFDEIGGFSGFGLDPVTSNYKVVWVRQFWDENRDDMFHRAYAAVYSCSTDSWRILKHKHHKSTCAYSYRDADSTAYLNGTYYWMLRGHDYCGLLSFDFANEVFAEIRGPHIPPINCSSVILRDGSINLLTLGFNDDFGLWVMIEPGVWTKLLNFQCLSLIKPVFCGFWDSSTVLFLTESSGLISYDVNTQETTHLGF
ncbi:uncharacterized protein LOC132062097 [Lycium ferocissimum]|uniref:uncharacterized protein LOC132062097 n=1 Tax=Lycium ferocissimum TaxID=112874 RepID=UPI0028162032|nr:uncharacterized protein LOC132062097 [Lycium ferocissimum]